MSQDLIGKQLGKYQIQAEIGRGGMGLVYLGYDPMLDRQVAIKVLAPHLVWETGFVDRFLREARSAARLKHPAIVTIYDVGQEGNWYYIVMEYLKGYTLSQLIIQHGPFSSKRVLPILRQLAGALDYAHRLEVVHRDVKPGNVVVDGDGRATLTDFGVARAAQETRLTSTGALVGTPQYMSPEQARGDEVDYRSDLYSLGVAAYEMLTGRAPFGATTPHAVLHQLIYDPPPPVRSLRPDLPAAVDPVMARALDKEPANRYKTAQDFVAALEGALAGQALPGVVSPQKARARPGSVGAEPQLRAPAAVPAAKPKQGALAVWLWWVLVGVAGWMLGWGLGMAVGELVGRTIGEFVGDVADPFAIEMASGAASWAVLGLFLGLGQWFVLRRHLRRAVWWLVATCASLALIGAVKWFQGAAMESILDPLIFELEMADWGMAAPFVGTGLAMVFEGASGLVLGVGQSLVLRRQAFGAGRWVWLNVLAWAAIAPVVGLLIWLLGEPPEEWGIWIFPSIGGVVISLITGLGMARLLSRKRIEP